MTTEFDTRYGLEKREGDPCRICGGKCVEYRDKNPGIRGARRWSRWCVGCDYAAKACKCPPQVRA